MHWYRIASCLHFIALHLVAIHSSLVDPAAPDHLSLWMRNVLQSAGIAKRSTITSCIVKSATTFQWTVNQSYYLLEQVGGFLLDITNSRKWFFTGTFSLKLNRHSYFRHFWDRTVSFKNDSEPTTPRFVWARWKCNKTRCSIPTSAGIDAHRGKSSAPKAQYGLQKPHLAYVMSATSMLAPVGSLKYLTLLLLSGSLCINDFRSW